MSDMRAEIEAAMEVDHVDTAVVDTSVDTSAAPITRDETPPDSPPAEAPEGTVRDALGRFVPKAKAGDTAPVAATTDPGSPAGIPVAPSPLDAPAAAAPLQPPAGLSVTAREHWASLPPAMQQEIHRRETDMQRFVNDTAYSRQVGDAFTRAVQPFQMAIQAEGTDPITAVTNLMQFASRMRMGTPAEKASTLAQLVKVYGVDIRALDDALVGAAPTPQSAADPQYVQQLVQQQLAPLYQAAQQRQQAMAAQTDAAVRSEMEQFAADPKHEYFNDVRGMMGDMIEVAQRQGIALSLAEAYQRSTMLHPEISRVMLARQQGVNAQQLTAAARNAKSAAVSVRGTAPVGNPNGVEPSSIRESIEAAIESHSRV